jgi:hypothetical protein
VNQSLLHHLLMDIVRKNYCYCCRHDGVGGMNAETVLNFQRHTVDDDVLFFTNHENEKEKES